MELFVFIPFLTAIGLLCFGRYLSRAGSMYLMCFNYSVGLIFGIIDLLRSLKKNISFSIDLWTWFYLNKTPISIGIIFDKLAIIIASIVFFVSFCVHLYGAWYIRKDPHLIRFIGYLSLFTFSILIIVVSPNLLQFFIGWEGIGLCSYLLINFWFTRLQANKSAIKAIIINKIGDLVLLLAIANVFVLFGSVDFYTLNSLFFEAVELPFQINNYRGGSEWHLLLRIQSIQFAYSAETVTLLLLVSAWCKSAQFGFHSWLPSAIEGPTPVSALIHAATIVTAGIYLLLRTSILLINTAASAPFYCVIGGLITILISSISAAFLFDYKRIIAYSTCSQLGYIFFVIGCLEYNSCFYHLINHAFFKAALFIVAGVIIHIKNGEQDLRKLAFNTFNYYLISIVLLTTCALLGLPLFSGFYSKEVIIGLVTLFIKINFSCGALFIGTKVCLIMLGIGVLFSTIYSLRTIYYLFFRQTKYYWQMKNLYVFNQLDLMYFIPITSLTLLGAVGGYAISHIFSGENIFFDHFYLHRKYYLIIDSGFITNRSQLTEQQLLLNDVANKTSARIYTLIQPYFFKLSEGAISYYRLQGDYDQIINYFHITKHAENFGIFTSSYNTATLIFVCTRFGLPLATLTYDDVYSGGHIIYRKFIYNPYKCISCDYTSLLGRLHIIKIDLITQACLQESAYTTNFNINVFIIIENYYKISANKEKLLELENIIKKSIPLYITFITIFFYCIFINLNLQQFKNNGLLIIRILIFQIKNYFYNVNTYISTNLVKPLAIQNFSTRITLSSVLGNLRVIYENGYFYYLHLFVKSIQKMGANNFFINEVSNFFNYCVIQRTFSQIFLNLEKNFFELNGTRGVEKVYRFLSLYILKLFNRFSIDKQILFLLLYILLVVLVLIFII